MAFIERLSPAQSDAENCKLGIAGINGGIPCNTDPLRSFIRPSSFSFRLENFQPEELSILSNAESIFFADLSPVEDLLEVIELSRH